MDDPAELTAEVPTKKKGIQVWPHLLSHIYEMMSSWPHLLGPRNEGSKFTTQKLVGYSLQWKLLAPFARP